MKITSAEFMRSVFEIKDFVKDGLPQIAFAGRSNVGKSSLLNALLNRKKLAFVSHTPGKTQCLNYYLINNTFYFVDLPGYGFARAPKSIQAAWHGLVETFLRDEVNLRLVVSLIDIRHPLSPLDMELWNWLQAYQKPFIIVATKADKLSAQQLHKQSLLITGELQKWGDKTVIAFSTISGVGKAEIWKVFLQNVQSKK